MGSSPGFASAARDWTPVSDSLSLRLACWLNLATHRNSLAHSTKGTPSQPRGLLRLLVGTRFQVLFHSPPGVLFTFPSRYWSTIGHRRVFRVGGWTPQLPTGFHVSGGTRADGGRLAFAYGALTLCRPPSQAVPLARRFLTAPRPAPRPRRRRSNRRFALGPRSLATTRGISFDFSSSGYLDVSVPRVIRRSAGRRACAPHRGLSQLVASFVGFLCQGIHRVPLTSFLKMSRDCIHKKCLDAIFNEEYIVLSRYAALKVRRGRALETGRCERRARKCQREPAVGPPSDQRRNKVKKIGCFPRSCLSLERR